MSLNKNNIMSEVRGERGFAYMSVHSAEVSRLAGYVVLGRGEERAPLEAHADLFQGGIVAILVKVHGEGLCQS